MYCGDTANRRSRSLPRRQSYGDTQRIRRTVPKLSCGRMLRRGFDQVNGRDWGRWVRFAGTVESEGTIYEVRLRVVGPPWTA